MTQEAQGTFEVTITPQDSDDGIGRLAIAKAWSGDLAGTGHGVMLSAGAPPPGAAGSGPSRAVGPPTIHSHGVVSADGPRGGGGHRRPGRGRLGARRPRAQPRRA